VRFISPLLVSACGVVESNHSPKATGLQSASGSPPVSRRRNEKSRRDSGSGRLLSARALLAHPFPTSYLLPASDSDGATTGSFRARSNSRRPKGSSAYRSGAARCDSSKMDGAWHPVSDHARGKSQVPAIRASGP